MTTPKRIQRQRTRGYRLPTGAVYVGRPSRFGNPFSTATVIELGYAHDEASARKAVVVEFEHWLRGRDVWTSEEGQRALARLLEGLPDLAGRDLACWCPLPAEGEPDVCHAAVLLKIANPTPRA